MKNCNLSLRKAKEMKTFCWSRLTKQSKSFLICIKILLVVKKLKVSLVLCEEKCKI